MSGPNRRRFLSQFVGGTAATLTLPQLLFASENHGDFDGRTSSPDVGIPDFPGGAPSEHDEEYWGRVRDQFPLAPGLILMNAANLCPSPYPVQNAVFQFTRDVDSDASFQNRGKFGGLKAVSYTHLTLPTTIPSCRSRWSPYH